MAAASAPSEPLIGLSQTNQAPRILTDVGAAIQPSPAYLEVLHSHLIYPGDLARSYPVNQLTRAELEKKIRCLRCSRACTKQKRKEPQKDDTKSGSNDADKAARSNESEQPLDVTAIVQVTQELSVEPQEDKDTEIKEKAKCKYHDGRVFRGKWSCCNGHVFAPPCKEEQDHVPRTYAPGELANYWRLFKAPPKPESQVRKVVVLDCEMGVAETGDTELIRLSMVDYFSCQVLIDSLVIPDVKMTHYSTRFSGITRSRMERARRSGKGIFGRKKARMEIWKHVGPNTIIVGHSLQGDLWSLRLIHPSVVDTLEVEKLASSRETGLSLKSLAKEKLGREIQIKGKGHDSLEDAIATRDLLHWHVSLALEQADANSLSLI